ncbi:protein AATF-like [Centruroides vittatus]|uniref:protein AATF-like n=1 Tax=Centruroides vittatus TaxID=120091 RepID=UPI00351078BB
MTSLAEEIAALINPAPTLIEPEDNVDFDTKATVVEKYEKDDIPVHQSQLRKKTAQINLGSKYAGKKISRKKLQEEYSESESISDADEEEEVDDDDDDDDEYETEDLLKDKRISLKKQVLSDRERLSEDLENIGDEDIESDLDEEEEDKSEESIDEEEEEEEEDDDEDEDDDDMDIVQKFSKIDVGEEIEKGKAVKSQLTLWDCLLECRIKLQKLLVIANKLPQPDNFNCFLEEGDIDYNDFTKQGSSSVKKLLDLLIDVQTKLLQKNPETRYVLDDKSRKVKKNSDEEISGSSEEESDSDETGGDQHVGKRKLTVDEYPEFLNKRHKNLTSFRNSTIQKWNEKTKVASSKLNQSSFNAFEQSALKQIEQILSDKPRLISRTQLKRSTYRILGKEEKKEEAEISESGKEKLPLQDHRVKDYNYDVEIFDDDDFYHHLLREIIERKTVDINDPIALSRQWLEIQKLRSKMKKKVDTKASKGRKIRFGVHSKMVNFMAPVDNCTMSDEAKNELFCSLFGRKN